jgi:hypothetical protein
MLMLKKVCLLLSIVLAITACTGAAISNYYTTDTVQISSGRVQGKTEWDIHFYLGTPYTAPPPSDYHFRPPQDIIAAVISTTSTFDYEALFFAPVFEG